MQKLRNCLQEAKAENYENTYFYHIITHFTHALKVTGGMEI
jgi:hypothetical protein